MAIRKIILSFVALTALYGLSLVFLDIKNNPFNEMKSALIFLPPLMVLTFISFFLRYVRWYWLLLSAGYSTPFWRGLIFYISGFALTATPGKVGELIRIRYFQRVNVPSSVVVSAFFFERTCDLLVVLILGLFAISTFDFFPLVAISILIIVSVLLILARNPFYLRLAVYFLRKLKLKKVASLFRVLVKGISGIYYWITPSGLLISFSLGALAWLILSVSFIWLLSVFYVEVDILKSLSIYPIAMLVGAISMLPGGVGSTEAAIVIQLTHYGAEISQAGIAAISIRIATMWFAILCGLISVIFLECKYKK